MVGGNSNPHQEPAVQARPHGLGAERAAKNPGVAGNRSVGERCARLQSDTHESGGRSLGDSAVCARTGSECASGIHHRGSVRQRGRRLANRLAPQLGRDATLWLKCVGIAYGEHGFCRNRGRRETHKSYTLPTLLSGKAHLLSPGRRHFRFWNRPERECDSIFQPAHWAVSRHRGSSECRAETDWTCRRPELRCVGRANWGGRRTADRLDACGGTPQAEYPGRIIGRLRRNRWRSDRPSRGLACGSRFPLTRPALARGHKPPYRRFGRPTRPGRRASSSRTPCRRSSPRAGPRTSSCRSPR